jgi:hypothetical protein
MTLGLGKPGFRLAAGAANGAGSVFVSLFPEAKEILRGGGVLLTRVDTNHTEVAMTTSRCPYEPGTGGH